MILQSCTASLFPKLSTFSKMSSSRRILGAPSVSPTLCEGLDVLSIRWGLCGTQHVVLIPLGSFFFHARLSWKLSVIYWKLCVIYFVWIFFTLGCFRHGNPYYPILDESRSPKQFWILRIYYLNHLFYICHVLFWKDSYLFVYKLRNINKFLYFILNLSPV